MFSVKMIQLILFILGATVKLSLQASLPTDPYYMAGVVEFRSPTGLTAEQRVLDSLNGYLGIINSDEAENLDIIVFPESTLNSNDQTTFVPNPAKELVVPCDANGEYHTFLVQLSCAAKNQTKYIVINLTEKELCSSVPEDNRQCATNGLNIFNTNVVFDRSGAVISRYRKVHLYGENKNTTFVPEFGWFDTDFGVRFGHFICFDILFYSPAQEMVVAHGIKDFIFNSMWFSQLPFLTAVQIQQSWSYANDVNLLASGASNPAVGSTGSGIYHGRRGYLIAKMNQGLGERKLYVSQVPKYFSGRHLQKRSLPATSASTARLSAPAIFLKRDYLQSYESVQVNLTSGNSLNHEICFSNTSFCCKFELRWKPLSAAEDSKHYLYRIGVLDQLRNEVSAETNHLKNCAVFSCIGDDIMDCGKVTDIDTDVIFENITITATFPKVEEYLLMPNSLTADNILPLPVSKFEWHEVIERNQHSVRFVLNTTTSNLLAFSIYGNYYDTEFSETPINGEDDGAASLATSVFVILSILLLNLIL